MTTAAQGPGDDSPQPGEEPAPARVRASAPPVASAAERPELSARHARRTPWWTVALIVVGVLVMGGSVSVYAFVNKVLDTTVKAVHTADLLGGAAAPVAVASASGGPIGNDINGALNLLIVGVDASGERTDSIIMAHIPASHDKMYLVSIPRDTRVEKVTGGTTKVNGTYVATSQYKTPMANLAATIHLNWGITFNGAIIVNFDGFKDIVDKLGGVTMYVDETTYSIHHGYIGTNMNDHAKPYNINPNTGVPICSKPGLTWAGHEDECTLPGVHEVVYKQGLYHFDSYDALDFVRCRDGLVGTDYARQRHQQQFIRAVLETAYSEGLSDPTKMFGFITALGHAFTFDRRGIPMEDWIFTLKAITPDNLITIKTNDGQFVSPPAGAPPDGAGSEQALNSDSLQLFHDVRDDKGSEDLIGAFLQQHPDWIASTNPTG